MAELVGGPFDGAKLSPRPGSFVWCAWTGSGGVRGFEAPGDGRELYMARGEAFVYAGHTHRLCSCGGYNEVGEVRVTHCGLCGAALPV